MLSSEHPTSFPPTAPSPSRWAFFAATLVYTAAVRMGIALATADHAIAPLWPATGISIWLVARYGPRMLVAMALGEFVANLFDEAPVTQMREVIEISIMALGNILTAFVGARMWHRNLNRWSSSLAEFCEPASALVAALVAPIIAATLGVAALLIFESKSPADAAELFLDWWTGDAVGALFIFPLLVSAPALGRHLRQASLSEWLRGALLIVTASGVSWLIFAEFSGGRYFFALFPLLLLATLWFQAPGVRLLALVIACTGTVAATRGHGSFVTGPNWQGMITVQLFLSVVAVVALILPVLHAGRNFRRRKTLGLLIGGWIVSGFLFALLQREQERENTSNFSQLTTNAGLGLEQRITTYVEAARGGAAFLYASHEVERKEWATYVQTLHLPHRYPGIVGLGLVYPVPARQLDQFVQHVRTDGATDFSIHAVPTGQSLPGHEHFIITNLEPDTENRAALGLDLASESTRRECASIARDTGEPQMSGQITLYFNQGKQQGFLLFVPVYRQDAPLTTVPERRAALRAWILVPIITDRFLQAVLAPRAEKIQLHLFRGSTPDQAHLIYTSEPDETTLPEFERVVSRVIYGQSFTLGWNRGRGFTTATHPLLLWLGMSFSLGVVLLTGWILSLESFRARAEALAAERTAKLAASEENLLITLNSIGDAVIATDTAGLITRMNPTAERLTGWSRADGTGRSLTEVFRTINSQTRAPSINPVQLVMQDGKAVGLANHTALLARDGREFQIAENAAPIRATDGQIIGVVLVFSDVTEKHQAEAQLRLSDLALKAISQGVIIAGPDQCVVSANSACLAITGYSANEMLGRNCKFLQGAATDPSTIQLIRNALHERKEFNGEILNYRKDGTPFWNELTISPVRDAHGTLLQFIGIIRDITARKQTEELLARSTQLLERTGRLAKIGGWEVNLQSMKLSWTSETFRITEIDPPVAPPLAEGIELFAPEARPTIAAAVQTTIDSGVSYDLELPLITRKGQRRWVQTQGFAEMKNGKAVRIFGTFQDITARKHAEALLQETEQRFHDLVDSTDGIVWEADAVTFAFNSVSNNAERILGYPIENWLHAGFWANHIHPDDRERAVQYCVECTGRLENHDFEYRFVAQDGRVVWLRDIVKVLEADGKPRWLRGLMVDITAQKKTAEAVLNERAKAERYLEVAEVILVAFDTAEKVTLLNRKGHEVLGYEKGELIGRNWFQYCLPPEEIETVANVYRRIFSGDVQPVEYYENHVLRRDGTKRLIAWNNSVLRDDDGKIIGILSSGEDITDKNAAQEAVRASLREKEALLKEVHHRVKNNLQVITSLLRLESGRSTHTATKSVLNDMQARIRSMAMLHESLYRSGTYAAVDLSVYLKQLTTQSFRALVTAPNAIRLQLDLAPVNVEMDQALPCGLLVNELISNCLKHAFPEGRTGEVQVQLQPDASSGKWRLRVSDNGIGLPPNFDVKRDQSLGLQLVSDLAQQLGGTLEIGPGPNAVFEVIFSVTRT